MRSHTRGGAFDLSKTSRAKLLRNPGILQARQPVNFLEIFLIDVLAFPEHCRGAIGYLISLR